MVTIRDSLQLLAQAHHGGDSTSLGDDDGMSGGGTSAQQHTCDLLSGHAGDNGGLYLLAAEDDLLVADLGLLDAQDVLGNALAHITEVNGAGCEVLVLHGLEHGSLLLGSLQHGLGSVAQLLNLADDAVMEGRILHHHAVCFHDGSLLLLILVLLHALYALAEDVSYSSEGTFGLVLLFVHRTRLIVHQITVQVLTCQHDLTHGDTGDNALTTNRYCHFSFPPVYKP